MGTRKLAPPTAWYLIPALSLVFFVVACGAAATATPVPASAPAATATPRPSPTIAPTSRPAAGPTATGAAAATAAPRPNPTAAPTSAPTAAPAATTAPVVKVHPGKVTSMVADLASESFDSVFQSGTAGGTNGLAAGSRAAQARNSTGLTCRRGSGPGSGPLSSSSCLCREGQG